ncbi:MAG: ribulose-phosphate 3-epimerase [Eubacterium sp.]|jgi:ribulose-phosphate 3-epimerase|nr:ribulose-phosphate 3-epimerase [Eubacterium sp.]
MVYKISPSILAADVSRFGEELAAVSQAGADYIHIDIMDGMFVQNISFGVPVVEGIRKCVDTFFDVHLMVHEPIRYIRDFAEAGADGITVHVEACEDLEATIDEIHNHGKKAAVSIKPRTDIDTILDILPKVYMVLVMTVEPGYGGQKIRRDTFDKIIRLRQYIEEHNLDVDIEVDGGVDLENVREVLDAGANVIVAGTKVFHGDVEENMKNFRKILEQY